MKGGVSEPVATGATVATTATAAAAHLVIHATSAADVGEPPASLAAWARRLLRALFAADRQRDTRATLCLHIDDLQGRRLLAMSHVAGLTDVPLQPGTYQVTAVLGALRRGYTVALAPGASCELYLRFSRSDS